MSYFTLLRGPVLAALVTVFLLLSLVSWWVSGSWDWIWLTIWHSHWRSR